MPVTQHLGECDQVDRFSYVPKIDKNAVDRSMRRNVKVIFVNFLDAFGNGFSRRNKHRPQDALLRINAVRRGPVNILRRTCGRNGNNFFAASRRRTSASAISRFSRLLSCPCGRWSRHLFRFFSLFFLSSEKSAFLWFLSRSAHWLRLRFFRGFHLKDKLGSHIMVQPDRDLVLAGIFDWTIQNNLMPVNFCPELVFESINDVLCSNRSECLARFTGFQREHQLRLADSTRQFFCLVQLARFALGALLLESIELAQSAWRNLVCFSARQKIISRITAAHFDHVGFSTESGHIFGQDEFSQRHTGFNKVRSEFLKSEGLCGCRV